MTMNDKDPIHRLHTKPMSQEEFLRKFGTENLLPGQARMLNEDEQRLREFIMRQNQGAQNIAPFSPLYDRVMGTNTHEDRAMFYDDDRASRASSRPSQSFVRAVGRIALWMILGAAVIGFSTLAILVRVSELQWWLS
jgi:hypothetical protein